MRVLVRVAITAAHRNGVPILGAVGSDFPDGTEHFRSLFTDEHLDRTVDQLVAMAEAFGFDGWLFDPESADMISPNMVRAIAALRSAACAGARLRS